MQARTQQSTVETDPARDDTDVRIAGRRGALRTLGLAGIGALAGLRLTGEAEARKESRSQRRRARRQRRAEAQKKKKGGKVGPTGPAGPMGPTGPAGSGAGATGPTGPAGISGAASDTVPGQGEAPLGLFGDVQNGPSGPSVTMTVPDSGRVLVFLTTMVSHKNPTTSILSFSCTGSGDNRPPGTDLGISYTSNINTDSMEGAISMTLSAAVPVMGLQPGPHPFTARYLQQDGMVGSALYSQRSMTVIPLP